MTLEKFIVHHKIHVMEQEILTIHIYNTLILIKVNVYKNVNIIGMLLIHQIIIINVRHKIVVFLLVLHMFKINNVLDHVHTSHISIVILYNTVLHQILVHKLLTN